MEKKNLTKKTDEDHDDFALLIRRTLFTQSDFHLWLDQNETTDHLITSINAFASDNFFLLKWLV